MAQPAPNLTPAATAQHAGAAGVSPSPAAADLIGGRYQILATQPLPALDGALSKAFEAQDRNQDRKDSSQPLAALLCPKGLPIRKAAIDGLLTLRHPQLVNVVAAGAAPVSSSGEHRFAVIAERPKGQTLAQVLAQAKQALFEQIIATNILAPIADALQQMAEKGISHGRINLNSVFLHEGKAILGECVSEPCGLHQPALFEPPERLACHPAGKEEGAFTADAYALGVIALHLLMGPRPFEALHDNERLAAQVHGMGAYAALTQKYDPSDFMRDLIRGTLADHPKDRWSAKQVAQWAAGKRFNLILPAVPRDAPRTYAFDGEEFLGQRALAHRLWQRWNDAAAELRDGKLQRWVELGSHKRDIGPALAKLSGKAGSEDSTKNERQRSDLTARVIILLDPEGPLRLRSLAFGLNGAGIMLADAYRRNQMGEVQSIADAIDFDLANYWVDAQHPPLEDSPGILGKLQRLRLFIRSPLLGSGMERALYDLNPTLPCVSPLVGGRHITTLSELLDALEQLAGQRASESPAPMDRHIAAFITSRLDLAKEVKLHEMAAMPKLAEHADLLAVKLLSLAQEKTGNKKYKALCGWMGERVETIVAHMHNRHARKDAEKAIHKAAEAGMFSALLTPLITSAELRHDQEYFQSAMEEYQRNSARIEELQAEAHVVERSRESGLRLSVTLAYLVLLITLYSTYSYYWG